MADQVGKCSVNNALLTENAFNINDIKEEHQEDDLADEKFHISETAIIIDKAELQDHSMHDKMTEYDISTIFDDIKTEPSSKIEYMIHDDFKIEEEINADNIKIEFNNGLLYCDECQVYCEDYCGQCGMLLHILNRTVAINTNNGSRNEFPPDSILEIHDYFGECRVFALKLIPAGVKFGPFTGINTADCQWKIKGGKFVVNKDKSKDLNWMQHINPARNISEQNLRVFQYECNLYYESTCHIQEGDELLVHFGEEYDDSLNRSVEMDFIPNAEYNFKDTFACTFCCLGFSSKSYLAKHKKICPRNEDEELLVEELVQCPSCKIHLDRKEYIEHHMAYCCERNDRKYNRTTDVHGRTSTPRLTYEGQQCKYSTQDKADLKDQHNEVKTYKCGICGGRFITKEVLRLHAENTHISVNGKDDLEHSTGVYMQAHIKAEQPCSQDEVKQFKCSLCELRTKYKNCFSRHVEAKHLIKGFVYRCDKCDYTANQRSQLEMHIETRHLKYKYKCDKCNYKANLSRTLKRHVETKHLKLFKYKCKACDYQTYVEYYLKTHIETKHSREFKYNCDTCDYKTNEKSVLKRHVAAKHVKSEYKCDTCDYKTSAKSTLKSHVQTKHPKCLYICIN